MDFVVCFLVKVNGRRRRLLFAWLGIDLKVFRVDNLDSIESDVLGSSAVAARSLKKDPPPSENRHTIIFACRNVMKNMSPLGGNSH